MNSGPGFNDKEDRADGSAPSNGNSGAKSDLNTPMAPMPDQSVSDGGLDEVVFMNRAKLTVDGIVDALAKTSSLEEISMVLEKFNQQVDDLQKLSQTTYAIEEFAIRVGSKREAQSVYDSLVAAKSLELEIAPEVLHMIPVANYGILVTRYNSGHYTDHVTPHTTEYRHSDEQIFSPDAQERIVADTQKLVAKGYIQDAAAEGFDNWMVNEKTGQVSLSGWTSLARAESQEDLDDFQSDMLDLVSTKPRSLG